VGINFVKSCIPIDRLELFPLRIPLRKPFKHAAHQRTDADPIVVAVMLSNGVVGFGDTLPRSYVTGENVESVIERIEHEIAPLLIDFRPASFAQLLEAMEELPCRSADGSVMTAARAGVELALLDAYSHAFNHRIADVVGWLGLPRFGWPGSRNNVRYSGVVSGDSIEAIRKSVRKMKWFGLRDYKLKVGYADDVDRIRAVADVLGRGLGSKRTLRLDANGAWSLEQACDCLLSVSDIPIEVVEEPLASAVDEDLATFRGATGAAVMYDESLVTLADAEALIDANVADAFNIRISKNGGLIPALRMAALALKKGVILQLGCMVGETSILSAAGRRFLELVPEVAFAEGSYSRFLLKDDVSVRPVRFGYGGKYRSLDGLGWGVDVRLDQLSRYVACEPVEFKF
jgi:muconate cycloisomerase